MFPNSASLVALALAALAAFPHVSADAAADKKAAEAALVGKLRLAPLATDRIALLNTDDQFAFDFFDPAAAATVGKGGKIITANAATFPAVIGTNSAMAAGLLEPCSMNTPHTHPRATEMQFSVNGTIRTGMITENTSRFIMTELPPGSMTIFPVGSIHFQINDGCDPILFVSSFNSEDPGVLQIAQRFLGLPPDIVGATLGDLGVEVVKGLEAQIPDNVAIGTDACLKRCGLSRPSQPTLQHQSRVSGNAFPTGTGDAYTYTYGTVEASSAPYGDNGPSTTSAAYTSYHSAMAGDAGGPTPSTALIALIAINGTLVLGLIVLGVLYFRKRRAANRVSRHKQLYTSISVSGDPLFVAPSKLSQYEDEEAHHAAAAGEDGPLTHGLTHGPYYDPHEPGSRPHSRSPSRQR
ncbi:RmlC-like cupin [Mycena filopes]|nr:RmlC-like cupin [Mycena filopes]